MCHISRARAQTTNIKVKHYHQCPLFFFCFWRMQRTLVVKGKTLALTLIRGPSLGWPQYPNPQYVWFPILLKGCQTSSVSRTKSRSFRFCFQTDCCSLAVHNTLKTLETIVQAECEGPRIHFQFLRFTDQCSDGFLLAFNADSSLPLNFGDISSGC